MCCFVIPAPLLAIKRSRTIKGTVIASALVVAGMWLERFLIIVPTLAQPRLSFNWSTYRADMGRSHADVRDRSVISFCCMRCSQSCFRSSRCGNTKKASRPASTARLQARAHVKLNSRARDMTKPKIVVFDTRDEVLAALRELKRAGVPDSSITVMSSEPLHLEESDAPRSRIPGFAIAGGLIGAAFALALTSWTSRQVGLVTGGMPIVSPWAFGIIVFELTALGAILATLGRMIYEAGLGRPRALATYDKAVADGRIVLALDSASDGERDNVIDRT